MLNIINGVLRTVTFDFGAEKALEKLAGCSNVREIGSDYAIVEASDDTFERLRDYWDFKIGCVVFDH